MRRLTRDAERLTDVRPRPSGGQCVGDGVTLELIGLPPQRDDGSERGGRVRIVTHRDQLKLMTRIASTFVDGRVNLERGVLVELGAEFLRDALE